MFNKSKNMQKILSRGIFVVLGVLLIGGGAFWIRYKKLSAPLCQQEVSFASRPAEEPFFSIILSTYNREGYLKRSICSALAQTYKNFELIIVDDGSKDNSVGLIRRFQNEDKRIVLLQNDKNRGISFSRNRGLEEARGKYITILDSDDYFFPELLNETKRYLQDNPSTDIVHGYMTTITDSNMYNMDVVSGSAVLENIFLYNVIPDVGTSYRREFVLRHGTRYDGTFLAAQDYKIFAQMIMAGAKVGMIKKVLGAYRMHTSNSEKYYKNMFQNTIVVKKMLWNYFVSKPPVSPCDIYSNLNEKAENVFSPEHIRQLRRYWCNP